MPHRACTVSFVERGQRHSAEVDAETAYEAAVLALRAFRARPYVTGPNRRTVLEIRVGAPLCVTRTVGDVLAWVFEARPATADARERQKRLRDLLAHTGH